MNQVSSHKVGLVVGGTLAIWHAIWSLMVLAGVAKPFLDWILGLHFMVFQYNVNPFDLLTAITLIVTTGIIGYIMGYLIGWLWNLAHRTAHGI